MDERLTSTARIRVDDEGIVRYSSIGTASTAASVVEGLTAVAELTGGRPAPILFDARGWGSGDPASWVQFINMIETVCSAAAVVVDEDSASSMGSFPGLLDTLVIPFRIFRSEDVALEFLREHV